METGTIEVTSRDEDDRPTHVRALQPTIAPDVNHARLFDELGVLYAEALEMFDMNLRATNKVERIRPYTVTATVLRPQLKLIRRHLRERGETLQAGLDEALGTHDLSAAAVAQLAEEDPDSLFTVRVTMFSTIRPAILKTPSVTGAWRRDAGAPERGSRSGDDPEPDGRA